MVDRRNPESMENLRAEGLLGRMEDVHVTAENAPSALPAMGEERKYTGLSGWLELQRLKKEGKSPDFNPYARDWQGKPMAPPPLTDDQALGLLSKQKKIEGMQADIDHKRLLSMIESDKHGVAMAEAKKKMAMDQGLREASQAGGIVGAMDFLKSNDPNEYMRLKKMQVDLEKGMLDNNKLRASSRADKLGTLAEGHTILANLGAQLEGLGSAKERAAMYQMYLPMMKGINTKFPNTYNQTAQNMLRMSSAFADPKALHRRAKNNEFEAQSNMGKLIADEYALIAQGVDPEDKRIKLLRSKQDQTLEQSEKAKMQIQMLETRQVTDKTKLEQTLIKDFKKENDKYFNIYDVYQDMLKVMEDKDKLKGVGDNALITMVVRLREKGPMTEPDIKRAAKSDPFFQSLLTIAKGYLVDGRKLSDDERMRLLNLGASHYRSQKETMLKSKDRYAKQFAKNGLSMEQLNMAATELELTPKPSEGRIKFLKQRPDLAHEFDKQYGPGASERYLKQ